MAQIAADKLDVEVCVKLLSLDKEENFTFSDLPKSTNLKDIWIKSEDAVNLKLKKKYNFDAMNEGSNIEVGLYNFVAKDFNTKLSELEKTLGKKELKKMTVKVAGPLEGQKKAFV